MPAWLALRLLARLLSKMFADGGSLQDVSSGCMLLTVCLCRRFMGQQGQSSLVSLSKERAQLQPPTLKPSPPKTTALLQKQGPCCVCERTPDTQPLMERIRLGCTTLIHCSRQHRLTPLCPLTKDCQEPRPAV